MRRLIAAIALALAFAAPVEAQRFGVIGLTQIEPGPEYQRIWNQVSRCLGYGSSSVDRVDWYVADGIVDWEERVLLYGLTAFDRDMKPIAITLLRRYANHPTVLSHEMTHAIDRTASEPTRCVIPGTLPRRPLPDHVTREDPNE